MTQNCSHCKINGSITKVKDLYFCKDCFLLQFYKKVKKSIKPFVNQKNIIMFDGTSKSSCLIRILDEIIIKHFRNNFQMVSNEKIYDFIEIVDYQKFDQKSDFIEFAENYAKDKNLISTDSLNDCAAKIVAELCSENFLKDKKDKLAPFENILETEIELFMKIDNKVVLRDFKFPLTVLEKTFNEFCNEIYESNFSSFNNMSEVMKKIKNKKLN